MEGFAPAPVLVPLTANDENWAGSEVGGLLVGDVVVARCAGFLATGGGAPPGLVLPALPAKVEAEVEVEVEPRRSRECPAPGGTAGKVDDRAGTGCGGVCVEVWRLGGGGGGASLFFGLRDMACSSAKFSRPTLAGSAAESNGGGSFLGAELDADVDSKVEWLMCS